MRALRLAYTCLVEDAQWLERSWLAEWLLDNLHIVTAAVRDVQRESGRRHRRMCPASARRRHSRPLVRYAPAAQIARCARFELPDGSQAIRSRLLCPIGKVTGVVRTPSVCAGHNGVRLAGAIRPRHLEPVDVLSGDF
jgi:hypothetical protein